jgi:hypothetical protein
MTAPWLAPDGREWFAARRGPRILVDDPTSPTGWVAPLRTPVAVAVRHLCALAGAGLLAQAALWGIRRGQ